MKLYELPMAFRVLDAMIDEAEGEITPEIEAMMANLQDTLETKVDAIGGLVREAQAEAEGFKAERERLAKREKIAAAKAERLKSYLFETMEATGKPKVEGRLFKAAVRQSGTPSIRWVVDTEIPERFRKVTVSLDGTKAQAAHKGMGLPEGFKVDYSKYLLLS